MASEIQAGSAAGGSHRYVRQRHNDAGAGERRVTFRAAGLIKFFREERHLEALLDGTLYCNTPEYYRLSASPGAGDRDESCTHSYRESRGDPPISLSIGDMNIDGLTEFTLYRGPIKDAWLHCWVAFQIPPDDEGLNRLVVDLNRMRTEFGPHFAFMPASSVKPFTERVQKLTPLKVMRGPVRYSENRSEWSVACKSRNFEYQREFRFVLGKCETSSPPLQIHDPSGFRDLIFGSHALRLTDAETDQVWLQLDREFCGVPSAGEVPQTRV